MVFSSLSFLTVFFPIVMALYFLKGSIRWRNNVLLVASLVFYGWGEPVWILGMLGSTFVNWVCAQLLSVAKTDKEKKLWLFIGILASALLLFICKYAAFFANSFLSIFGASYRLPGIDLPIGISFYTFQIISYTVDVYREETPAQRSYSRLLLYVSCFPQLIAGPIVRYSDVQKQIGKRKTTPVSFSKGMRRFVAGLCKKVIFANLCGLIVDALSAAGEGTALSFLGSWYFALIYTLQVYFDFSGYSDMAIGMGKILGFTYRENFNYPLISTSIGEFWRRWHISLMEWFREYLLYPLMRTSFFRRLSMKKSKRFGKMFYRNLTAILCTSVVWAFTGLWHGASWSYVLWGMYFGFFQLIEKFVFEKRLSKVPAPVKWPFTMFILLIGFVIFHYTDISNVFGHVSAMLGFGAKGFMDEATLTIIKTYSFFPVIAFICAMPVAKAVEALLNRVLPRHSEIAYAGFMLLGYTFSLLFLVGQSFNPFIYFQF